MWYCPEDCGDDEEPEGSWTSTRNILIGSYLLQEAFSDLPSLLDWEMTKGLGTSRAVIRKSRGAVGAWRGGRGKPRQKRKRVLSAEQRSKQQLDLFLGVGGLAISKNGLSV